MRQIADRCELDGDPWGRMLCLLSAGISLLAAGEPAIDELERTADIARQHGATLIELIALDRPFDRPTRIAHRRG